MMRLRAMLVGLFAAVLSSWLLFAIAALPDRSAPWSASERLHLPVDRFSSPSGAVSIDGRMLVSEAADPAGRTIALLEGLDFDAAHYRFLRFDLRITPPTTRPLLIWSGPDGLHTAAIPWHSGEMTIDLGKLDGWTGPVSSLGLALVPLDAVSTAASLPRRLALSGFSLSGDNRRDAMAALWSEWCAWQPWNGRSINTGGFSLPVERGLRPLPGLLLIAAVTACLLWLALGRRHGRRIALGTLVLLWLLLDLMQLRQLGWRTESALAARAAAPAGEPLTGQPALSQPMADLQRALRAHPDRPVIVYGEQPFWREYPAFLLRNHDVGTLQQLDALPADAAARGAILVLAGPGPWRFDAAAGVLQFGQHALRADPLVAPSPVLQAYRLRTAMRP